MDLTNNNDHESYEWDELNVFYLKRLSFGGYVSSWLLIKDSLKIYSVNGSRE